MAPTVFHSLRALRDLAGLSQTALAEAVGIRQATVSEWENGGNVRIDLDVLDRLCRVLAKHAARDVTLADLRRKRG